MAKGAKPFKYRGKWRAQITLANGTRPAQDFRDYSEAVKWLAKQLTEADSEHQPQLGGPTVATLADALHEYAELYSINKGGAASELNRINHYLEGAGKALVKVGQNATGGKMLVEYTRARLPSGWQDHNDARRAARSQTYHRIAELAGKRCSAISTADIRRLMSDMQKEGLSESTIQKEIALLKHLFNVAEREWNWNGFANPCAGIKLGKSASRFVFITQKERARLWQALAECDNPYYWPLVEFCLQTTLRRSSLLEMQWNMVDLEGRAAMVPSKTGQVVIPLTRHAVSILQNMPRHPSGKVFPMSANAVDMAWDGVRQKAGVPTLQFRDLRHLSATEFARRGFNSHQLQVVLGHKTTFMAQVYVNLVNKDVLDIMDRTEPGAAIVQIPPTAVDCADAIVKRRRTERLTDAVLARLREHEPAQPIPNDAGGSPAIAPVEPMTAAATPPTHLAEPGPARPRTNVVAVDFGVRRAAS